MTVELQYTGEKIDRKAEKVECDIGRRPQQKFGIIHMQCAFLRWPYETFKL